MDPVAMLQWGASEEGQVETIAIDDSLRLIFCPQAAAEIP